MKSPVERVATAAKTQRVTGAIWASVPLTERKRHLARASHHGCSISNTSPAAASIWIEPPARDLKEIVAK